MEPAVAAETPLDAQKGGPPTHEAVISLTARTTSVVIPAKNEALNIGWVLRRIPDFVDEVIIVDGLSHDGTLQVAKSIQPDVITVSEMRPGKGAAVRAGLEAASGDYVVMIDADGSMDPGEITRFVQALDAGADLVKGSRNMPGGASTDITFIRHLGNNALLTLTNAVYGTRFSELCYGYMALRRSALHLLQLDATGFEIEMQIVARSVLNGLRITEVPSLEAARRNGQSNLHAVRDGIRVLRVLLGERVYGHRPSPALTPIPIEVGAEASDGRIDSM